MPHHNCRPSSKAKREWLQRFLKLPGGIPSHDTFNRVILGFDPEHLEKGFRAWVGLIAQRTAGEVVAIDDKAMSGTREREHAVEEAAYIIKAESWEIELVSSGVQMGPETPQSTSKYPSTTSIAQ